jgi:hypothetical protein
VCFNLLCSFFFAGSGLKFLYLIIQANDCGSMIGETGWSVQVE